MRSRSVEPLIQRLPPLKRAASLTEAEARRALRCLHEFSYYPIPEVLGQEVPRKTTDAPVLDSGYVSENEADEIASENKAISLYLELGAGTGLVSMVLASLLPSIADSLPSIVATDYHPTVLKNLERNAASLGSRTKPAASMQVAHLDWCAPTREPPLDVLADIVIAADVVYAAEHARWLRHCAAHILAPGGVFWLMVSIRPNGKFEGVCDSIEAIFAENNTATTDSCQHLRILSKQWIDKKHNIGRADEVGYRLFKIGWV
ncbi:hypothetical protein TRIATDRAFT_298785 [Trichoderma atroviride IMI 206040]|uniref:Methyltransferase domain-containing protein n=1 Tax=Hypocrea atroviridis (strain ATCC 20476 / IMI 206040) TaxID=452589 RepID=G9NQR0_HYPAI|nr:uncharacterized protein TRIATDRAFT_298785 [Trichoderma atroviride IMI 206040]EHK46882.1 hypothetical protein TRIATDRAFT_298785 [Trichoderma atroviride IMI 206040]